MKREIGILSDPSLLLRLCVACVIDIIVLVTWAVVDPVTRARERIKKIPKHDEDVIIELYIYRCTSKHYMAWVGSICGLKGVFLIFGVFLAWETKNVHYLALNDSKNIGLAVYNIFMFSCLALVVEFVVTYLHLTTLVERSITLVGTTSTICLLFVPKILHLKKNNHVNCVSEFANGRQPTMYGHSEMGIRSIRSTPPQW